MTWIYGIKLIVDFKDNYAYVRRKERTWSSVNIWPAQHYIIIARLMSHFYTVKVHRQAFHCMGPWEDYNEVVGTGVCFNILFYSDIAIQVHSHVLFESSYLQYNYQVRIYRLLINYS